MTAPRHTEKMPLPSRDELEAAYYWDSVACRLRRRSTFELIGTRTDSRFTGGGRVVIVHKAVSYFQDSLLDVMGIDHPQYVKPTPGPKPGYKFGKRESPTSARDMKSPPQPRVSSIFDLGRAL